MADIEFFQQAYQLIKENFYDYNGDEEYFFLYNNEILSSFLTTNEVNFTPLSEETIEVRNNDFPFVPFFNDEELVKKKQLVKSSFWNQNNIGVLSLNTGTPRFYDFTEGIEYKNFVSNKCFFLKNIKSYLYFVDYLKEKSGDDFSNHHFIDHFDQNTQNFILTSSKQPGKLIITLPKTLPYLTEDEDLSFNLQKIKEGFSDDNKNFPIFLKNEVYNHLQRIDEPKRLPFLFKNFKQIYFEAEKNFYVYLNDLSLDNIKKEYQEFKERSFEYLSNILGKITNQIIALPLTVLAAIYAINRVSDSLEGILLILVALIVVSAYLSSILKLFYNDVRVTQKSLNQEFRTLTKSDFFEKYPEERAEFEEIKSRIKSRCGHLKIVLKSYFIIMHTFNIGLICYSIAAYSGESFMASFTGLSILLPILYFLAWGILFVLVIFK